MNSFQGIDSPLFIVLDLSDNVIDFWVLNLSCIAKFTCFRRNYLLHHFKRLNMKLGFLMLLLALTTTIYAKEILVSSEAEFASALQKAVGGDMIVWKAGEYQNVKLNFVSSAAVSATNPIIFKAEQS